MRGSEYADLRAFAAVAEHGNFARAAAQLRIAPSTLSQTIRELEERLGVQLLNRTTRSTSLTEAERGYWPVSSPRCRRCRRPWPTSATSTARHPGPSACWCPVLQQRR